jgi:hypothetical protein
MRRPPADTSPGAWCGHSHQQKAYTHNQSRRTATLESATTASQEFLRVANDAHGLPPMIGHSAGWEGSKGHRISRRPLGIFTPTAEMFATSRRYKVRACMLRPPRSSLAPTTTPTRMLRVATTMRPQRRRSSSWRACSSNWQPERTRVQFVLLPTSVRLTSARPTREAGGALNASPMQAEGCSV